MPGMGRVKEFVGLIVSCVVVFVTTGCVAVLSLAVWRLIARDVGSSLYTWTAILGLGLSGLCLGGRLGGWAADRYHARRVLAVVYALFSAACVGIILLSNALAGWGWLWQLSWPVHVFLHIGLVLGLPSVLLGAIGPATVKETLDLGLTPGRTVGDLFTWAAGGAVLGVFMAGFYLIPRFDNVMMIWAIGAVMLAIAMLYWISCWALYLWAMIFGTLATMGMAPAPWAYEAGVGAHLREPNDPSVLYEAQTAYGRVAVRRLSTRPERRLFEQDQDEGSEIVVGQLTNLQAIETQICAALARGLLAGKAAPSMMVIDGRGYVLARYLQASWPQGYVEVVEVDPGVTEAAIRAFDLEEDTAVETVRMDARHYVEQLIKSEDLRRYDLICSDVRRDGSAPFQVVTKEFNEKIAGRLTEDGVYIVTLTDAYDSGRFLGAVVETLGQTFPHIYVLGHRLAQALQPETFVVAAARRPLDPAAMLTVYDEHMMFWLLDQSDRAEVKEKGQGVVLTDDLAPVENLLAPAVGRAGPRKLARKCLRQAEAFRDRGMYDRSIEMYRRAVALEPLVSVRAYDEIGSMRLAQEDLQGAEEAWREAIRSREKLELWEPEIASVYMNLGMLLKRMNESTEARQPLRQAARWFRVDLQRRENSAVLWERLGDTLVLTGDLKDASEAFEKALALEPENAGHYKKLAKVYESQRRYGEAIGVAKRHVTLLKLRGAKDEAFQLQQYVELLEYEKVKAGK